MPVVKLLREKSAKVEMKLEKERLTSRRADYKPIQVECGCSVLVCDLEGNRGYKRRVEVRVDDVLVRTIRWPKDTGKSNRKTNPEEDTQDEEERDRGYSNRDYPKPSRVESSKIFRSRISYLKPCLNS